jgi:hypothetical protein
MTCAQMTVLKLCHSYTSQLRPFPILDLHLRSITPLRRIEYYAHQTSRNDAGDGQRDKPTEVDPRNHSPVDRPPIAAAKADADGCARDALGGRDWEFCEESDEGYWHVR